MPTIPPPCRPSRSRRGQPVTRLRTLALLLAFGVVLAACGSSDDSSSDGGPATTSGGSDTPVGPSDEIPVDGGDLLVGIQADTDAWDPTEGQWTGDGHIIAQTFYDSLAMFDDNGEAKPYLAESFTPNEDTTEWTIVLRPDITFHNGTPLNAEAVVTNLAAQLESPLVGPMFNPVDPERLMAVDELTVTVGMTQPWATFPVALTTQGGYIAEPTTVGTDEAARAPVGTGPFVFEEWIVGDHLTVTKNPDYWQAGKPHVDSIEFRTLSDPQTLANTLRSGGVNMIQVSAAESIARLQNEDFTVVDDAGAGEEEFILLNTGVAPTDDVRVRQALAHGLDLEAYGEVIDAGTRIPARSPFAPSLPWHSEEAVDAYPAFDPDAARALVEEYEAEVGPIEIVLQDTQGEETELAFLQESWAQIGIDVEVVIAEQATHVLDGLSGNYQALGWRLFGNPDPDGDYFFWDSANAAPQGELALNMARFTDPDFQAALDAGRATADFDERKAAYDEAQTIMNEQVPYVWQSHVLWAFVGEAEVMNMAYYELPDGETGFPLYAGFSGATKYTDIWLQQ